MVFLKLPERTVKDRTFGITSIADFGISIGELRYILDDYHSFIDIAKISIGSAYITPNIKEKIVLYKEYDIMPYCGGTLFEKFYSQGKFDDYLLYLSQLSVDVIEISTGILDIPIEERMDLVEKCRRDFCVIGEVGSKDVAKEMPPIKWQDEMKALIEAGCKYVIAEGRNSGTSGIYHSNGKIRENLVHDVAKNIDYTKIIFEAPKPASQNYFINKFGANVNLGNVNIHDVVLLESERRGLRQETFYLEEKKCKLSL